MTIDQLIQKLQDSRDYAGGDIPVAILDQGYDFDLDAIADGYLDEDSSSTTAFVLLLRDEFHA